MSNKELLFSITKKDFEIQTFKSGGKGGQHQNTCDSGVRIIHRPSGAITESREERSQLSNKKKAIQRIKNHPKFKIWLSKMINEVCEGKTTEEKVDEMMNEKNLRFEIKKNKKWRGE